MPQCLLVYVQYVQLRQNPTVYVFAISNKIAALRAVEQRMLVSPHAWDCMVPAAVLVLTYWNQSATVSAGSFLPILRMAYDVPDAHSVDATPHNVPSMRFWLQSEWPPAGAR